jgi:hypothetical protein
MRRQLIQSLIAIWELAPEMRFGQLMATLGFMAEDDSDHTMWEIEDTELLKVLERHRGELAARQSSETEPSTAKGH